MAYTFETVTGVAPQALDGGSESDGLRLLLAVERRRAERAEEFARALEEVGAAPDLTSAAEAVVGAAVRLLGGLRGVARIYDPLHPATRLALRMSYGAAS